MKTSFEIIATRALEVVDDKGKHVRDVLVHIGRPVQEPTGEWSLAYQVVGVRSGRVLRVLGFDAIEVLQGVHFVIDSVLASSDEAKQGRLRWNGHRELGFDISLATTPPGENVEPDSPMR
jgi:hypothetical protein